MNIDPATITKVYSGIPLHCNGCRCGCNSKYRTSKKAILAVVQLLSNHPNTTFNNITKCYEVTYNNQIYSAHLH